MPLTVINFFSEVKNVWTGKGTCCKRCIEYGAEYKGFYHIKSCGTEQCDFHNKDCIKCSKGKCIAFQPESQTD